ncbi:MAG: hypothetical protein Q7T97_02410 [Burkholderiaceae bacterium]|nr:hypothetical protein [Burkholderiaceae bacterium]
MTCPDCTTAAERDWYGYTSQCKACDARALSRGPDFDRVRRAGKLDARYQRALDQIGLTHKEVRAAFDGDRVNRKDAA